MSTTEGAKPGNTEDVQTARVPDGWRCFHCDAAFIDAKQAALHFGTKLRHDPVCQVSAERLRELELQLERYQEEDTDLHRQIYRMQAQHATALRREEEKGYARGLRDAAMPTTQIPPAPTVQRMNFQPVDSEP